MAGKVEGSLTIVAVWAPLLGLSLIALQPLGGQVRDSQPASPARQQRVATQANAHQKETFEGKIVKSGDKRLIFEDRKKTRYQLDDQQLAELFEGKVVKLTGTLDPKSGTIYISDIAILNKSPVATKSTPGGHKVPPRIEYGVASWYQRDGQGPWTASGEPFDDRAVTAAHLSLPLGTRVKVTNLTNGHSVLVRINDRGPFIPGRLIDLSKRAAEKLGFIHQGLVAVRMCVVSTPGGVPTS